jgi:hypothetical protein
LLALDHLPKPYEILSDIQRIVVESIFFPENDANIPSYVCGLEVNAELEVIQYLVLDGEHCGSALCLRIIDVIPTAADLQLLNALFVRVDVVKSVLPVRLRHCL